jgi:conjugative relaxase-like TrwC/TraI family protein
MAVVWSMLSIAKLRVGQEAYQLSGVAQSLDDYYTGAGEAHGQWLGGSAAHLGLVGQVTPDDLRAVLAGIRPGSGGLSPNGDEIRPHPRRVPGFDLTFKAPKSASVLYAVSDDPRVQGAVIDAGEAAMRAAVGWLEREAIQVQRGSHNQAYLARLEPAERAAAGPRREPTAGVVAASFRHRTSRASDPLLHWHVLVANLVQGIDGRWSAFAHPDLYRHVRAAGEVFQAVFRAELTASLGVEWRPGRTVPEIAGIPQPILDQFSKRSAEIETWLAATGTPNTPEGRQAAVLATRRNKPEVEAERFDAAWKLEAQEAGWGPAHAEGLIASCSHREVAEYAEAWRLETVGFDEHGNPDVYERTVEPEEWIADLLRRDLTNDRSTFTRADVTQAVASRQGAGASIETIERLADAVIASAHCIPVHNDSGPPRWTSRQLADTEQRFAAALECTSADRVPPAAISQARADRPTLGDDQATSVDQICGSTAAVSVLVGPAGTGKTFTIDAIAAAFSATGIDVRGVAPSARAAIELSAATGVRATTMHSLLSGWERGSSEPNGGLLIVDEAGMADIRTLTEVVVRHVDGGGRVLLAGDHHQLPEIGAGGGFEYATHHAHTVAELTTNRRQRNTWEHEALAQLRHGDVRSAVTAYANHERVTVAPTSADLVTLAVDQWRAARADGLDPILLAGTNELVDRLNQACIDDLISTGAIADVPATDYGTQSFRPGERVVVRRNHTLDDVLVANGHTGTVMYAKDGQLQIELDSGQLITLDDAYLRRGGHVTHAYALTTHRSQGGTWDFAIAVGTDALYRESAYVQLSRGIEANRIILTDPEYAHLVDALLPEMERHDSTLTLPDETPPDVEEHLTRRLARSSAKHLAHTHDPDLDTVDRLATSVPLVELEALRHQAQLAHRHAASIYRTTRNELVDQRSLVEHNARHLAVGYTVSPTDRHNVGTVVGMRDDGAVNVHFSSRDGHEAHRTFTCGQLRIIEPTSPPERQLSTRAESLLEQALMQFDRAIDAFDASLRQFGSQVGDLDLYDRAVARVVDRDTNQLVADRPGWLTELLGTCPDDVAGATTWTDAVRSIAVWRARNTIDETATGLGERPTDPARASQWTELHRSVASVRIWLATTDRTAPDSAVTRTTAELHDRLEVLDAIFNEAPGDARHLIAELHAGQLSFDDTAELLQAAVRQQSARDRWIIEHWPHIVEHQEIVRALIAPSHLPPAANVEVHDLDSSLDSAVDLDF